MDANSDVKTVIHLTTTHTGSTTSRTKRQWENRITVTNMKLSCLKHAVSGSA